MMHLLAEGGLAMAFVYLTNILIAPITRIQQAGAKLRSVFVKALLWC